jgi:hypothetical protein
MSHHRCPSNWLRAALLVSTFLVAKILPAQGSEDELPKMRQGFVLAASLPVRLRQMRKLAREFSAKLVPPNRTVVPLRLLSAPIYRYPPPDRRSEVIDGAVFAFAQATDPEVLLIIEAIGNNPQDERWRYGLARMSMVPTKVMHHDQIVWETDWAAIRQRSGPYYVISQYEAEITSSD